MERDQWEQAARQLEQRAVQAESEKAAGTKADTHSRDRIKYLEDQVLEANESERAKQIELGDLLIVYSDLEDRLTKYKVGLIISK